MVARGILSALVAFGNGWLCEIGYRVVCWNSAAPRRWHRTMIIAPTAMFVSISYGNYCLETFHPDYGPTVALMGRHDWLIQPDRRFSNSQQTRLDQKEQLVVPDLLVWPELADHHKLMTGSPATLSKLPQDLRVLANIIPSDYCTWCRERLASAASQANAAVLVGCERVDITEGRIRRFNTVIYADPTEGFIGFCDKKHLAPIIERDALTASWLGLSTWRQYTPCESPNSFTLESDSGARRFACVVCYDIAYPNYISSLCDNGEADFLVHCGSEAADPSGCLARTMFRMARLRAIEMRRSIVRNCHGGVSGVIDAVGRFTPGGSGVEGNSKCIIVPINSSDKQHAKFGSASKGLGSMMLILCGICIPWRKSLVPLRYIFSLNVRDECEVNPQQNYSSRTAGFSLLELLAVVVILGTIATVLMPRLSQVTQVAKQKADEMNQAQINAAVERFQILEGDWPANDLSDIASNTNYFSNGIPNNPVNNLPYQLNPTTHRVIPTGGGGGGGGGK